MSAQLLGEDEPWQVHHRVRRSHGGGDYGLDKVVLLHTNRHRQGRCNESEVELGCVA